MSHIKKVGLVFLLQLLLLVNLKADMLFYYSAAVLPSIISNSQPRSDLSGLLTGEFVSDDGTVYPMTAIISANNKIRIFSLDFSSNPYSQTIDQHMDGVLQVDNGVLTSTLNYYYDDNSDGIGSFTSTLLFSANSSGNTLSGTYTSAEKNGTFLFTYSTCEDGDAECEDEYGSVTAPFNELQLAGLYGSMLDTISTVYISESGQVTGEYGSCQYDSGQFTSIAPYSDTFSVTINYKCGEETTTYTGLGIGILSQDEYSDDDILFSISNGSTSIVDYLSGVY